MVLRHVGVSMISDHRSRTHCHVCQGPANAVVCQMLWLMREIVTLGFLLKATDLVGSQICFIVITIVQRIKFVGCVRVGACHGLRNTVS